MQGHREVDPKNLHLSIVETMSAMARGVTVGSDTDGVELLSYTGHPQALYSIAQT